MGQYTAKYTESDFEEAVAYVRQLTSIIPRVAVVLGSGMSDLADIIAEKTTISYAEIPNLPSTSAPGHRGQLHIGTIAGVPCVVMQGRLHLYEGFMPEDVVFPIRLMRRLGAEILLATNAAGGVNKTYRVGDLVLVEDHINLAGFAGLDPMRGPNIDAFGSRFTPLNQAYEPRLLEMLEGAAAELEIKTHRGVYGFACGPCFETPAEVRFLHIIGVDAVGMSTVPEVLAARHCGMQVAVISAITNISVHESDSAQVTTEEEVWENVPAIMLEVAKLVESVIARLKSNNDK